MENIWNTKAGDVLHLLFILAAKCVRIFFTEIFSLSCTCFLFVVQYIIIIIKNLPKLRVDKSQ